MGAIRRGITWVFRRFIVPAYFRDVEVEGDVPAPDVRGRLFVSNHVNAILDPILVFVTSGCDISPVAKSTLWSVPGLRTLLGVVDSVRIVRRTDDPTKQGGENDQVFDEVAAWLRAGGNILIFPEGTSHNEPHLVPLKSGAARMLLRARASRSSSRDEAASSPNPPRAGAREMDPADALTVQSIVLEFDDREQARSRVLLRYGPVRRAAEFTGEGDAFIAAFNEAVRRDLSDELVEAPTWDDYRLLARAAEMLANDAGDPSLSTWSRFARQMKSALSLSATEAAPGSPSAKGDPGGAAARMPAKPLDFAEIAALREAMNAYHARLSTLGLTDADIAAPPRPPPAPPGRKLALFLTLPLAVTGILLQLPPYLATRFFAGRVKSGDETTTIRLGVALALHPPWTALLLGLSFWRLPLPWSLVAAAITLASPVATIAWIDALPRVVRGVRRLVRRADLPAAREARAAAMDRVLYFARQLRQS